MIPEIDIWRVANLMLTRYGEEAMLESAQRAHELASDGDCAGAATWLCIANAIVQLCEHFGDGALKRRPSIGTLNARQPLAAREAAPGG
jgi:hypothetical protein